MKTTTRIITERPLNAETPTEYLTSWITPNAVFFDRNQGALPPRRIALRRWRLTVEEEVERPITGTRDYLARKERSLG
jgi:DMSO/TMAO reductase YedYZ molybdopterin-dependent catalytic subunit